MNGVNLTVAWIGQNAARNWWQKCKSQGGLKSLECTQHLRSIQYPYVCLRLTSSSLLAYSKGWAHWTFKNPFRIIYRFYDISVENCTQCPSKHFAKVERENVSGRIFGKPTISKYELNQKLWAERRRGGQHDKALSVTTCGRDDRHITQLVNLIPPRRSQLYIVASNPN
jgi:hypothetical protein